MSKSSRTKLPKLRRLKASNRAFVDLSGKRIYLGNRDDPEKEQRHDLIIADWLANGRRPAVAPEAITVNEMVLAYLDHVKNYYVHADGTPTSSQHQIKSSVKALWTLYGRELVTEFGPRRLLALQQQWVSEGYSRRTCNDFLSMVKAAFKWAASRELIPAEVYLPRPYDGRGIEGGTNGGPGKQKSAPCPCGACRTGKAVSLAAGWGHGRAPTADRRARRRVDRAPSEGFRHGG